MSPPIRLVVVDSRDLHREALTAAFDAEDDLEVIARVVPGSADTDQALHLRPDVVCVGSAPPARQGLALCERIKAEHPDQRVLLIDDVGNPDVLRSAVRAGVEGYAIMKAPLAQLIDALRRVHGGEAVIPGPLLAGLLRELAVCGRLADESYERFLRLSAREKQVLELLADGCGNKTISEILVISPQTARTHVQNVVRKLGTHSRLQAAAMATEQGWLTHRTSGRHRR